MTARSQAREIIEHYERRGLRGDAMKRRIMKHALVLWGQDRATALALWRSAEKR